MAGKAWSQAEFMESRCVTEPPGSSRDSAGLISQSCLDRAPIRCGSCQPHHHFVPADEVGGLAEQLHVRHRDGAGLLPNQHGVVQLHIAPSNRWDQILALHGQERLSSH